MFDLPLLLNSVRSRVRPPVVIVMGSPAQAAELAAALGEPDTTCFQFDLHQANKLRRILAGPEESANPGETGDTPPAAPAATVEILPDLWDLPAKFNTVLLPISTHGERELKLDLLEQAFHVLAPKGLLISLSEYEADQLLPKQHKKIFGKCSEMPSTRAGSVFWSVRDGDRPRRRHEQKYHAKIGNGPPHEFVSRPGVFSYGEMDEGSRALLECAEIGEGDHVLDLGCGGGSVGVLAADRCGPTGHVTFLDSNVRAISLAKMNAEANGMTNFRTMSTEGMEGLEPGSFDVILANPPYYANSWIAQMFVQNSKTLLKPNGRFYLVTKMVNHVAPTMVEVFGDIVAMERRGYTILEGGVPE
jgi:16S rRNA G1207 methylase RsmC